MNTRIIIYTGHRDIGLVLASHYFLNKNLVMTLPEPDRYTAFDSSNSGVTLRGQVVILHSNTVDMPSKNLQEFRLPQVAVIYHNEVLYHLCHNACVYCNCAHIIT